MRHDQKKNLFINYFSIFLLSKLFNKYLSVSPIFYISMPPGKLFLYRNIIWNKKVTILINLINNLANSLLKLIQFGEPKSIEHGAADSHHLLVNKNDLNEKLDDNTHAYIITCQTGHDHGHCSRWFDVGENGVGWAGEGGRWWGIGVGWDDGIKCFRYELEKRRQMSMKLGRPGQSIVHVEDSGWQRTERPSPVTYDDLGRRAEPCWVQDHREPLKAVGRKGRVNWSEKDLGAVCRLHGGRGNVEPKRLIRSWWQQLWGSGSLAGRSQFYCFLGPHTVPCKRL